MLDEALRAIIVRYPEGLNEGGVNRLEEPLPHADRQSLDNLDTHQWHSRQTLESVCTTIADAETGPGWDVVAAESSGTRPPSRRLTPDPVEIVLVLGEHPALGDAAVTEAVQPVGSPLKSGSATDHPSGCDDEPVLVVRQHVVHGDLERSVGELASSLDVLNDLGDPSILTGDRAPTGNVPDDVFGEDLGEGGVVARRARLVLSSEKLLVRVHPKDPIR